MVKRLGKDKDWNTNITIFTIAKREINIWRYIYRFTLIPGHGMI